MPRSFFQATNTIPSAMPFRGEHATTKTVGSNTPVQFVDRHNTERTHANHALQTPQQPTTGLPSRPTVWPVSNTSQDSHSLLNSIISPVNSKLFGEFLSGYPDDLREELVDGFANGFSIGSTGPHNRPVALNLKTALANPRAVQAKIEKELAAGRVLGPVQLFSV